MAKIYVPSPFALTLDDHTTRQFAAGFHDVDDAIANHWWVKVHTADPDASEPVEDPAGGEPTKDDLLAKAKELGLAVDGRWSVERLATAIAEAEVQ